MSGKRHAASVAIDYRPPAWSQASVTGLVRAPAPGQRVWLRAVGEQRLPAHGRSAAPRGRQTPGDESPSSRGWWLEPPIEPAHHSLLQARRCRQDLRHKDKEPTHHRPNHLPLQPGLRTSRQVCPHHSSPSRRGPQSPLLTSCAAPPLAVSRRALCVDLRGVNGGLNATSPPLVPPRPTGSTRARRL